MQDSKKPLNHPPPISYFQRGVFQGPSLLLRCLDMGLSPGEEALYNWTETEEGRGPPCLSRNGSDILTHLPTG